MRKRSRFAALAVGCLALAFPTCRSTQPDGTLHVILSCSRADTATVNIDGRAAGTVAHSSSSDFMLKPGSHSVSAQSGNGFTWNPRSLTITSGQRTVFDLIC